MAGHSKWANMKHRKARQDAKKNKIWTKMIRELTTAARISPDVAANPRLRLAVDKALSENMTRDTIERAIKRGAGMQDGEQYEELVYEGYGPGGVAVIVETMTDNNKRTVADVRHAFSKYGGNLGTSGSVAYMFQRKGVLLFAPGIDEDQLLELALDAGADDVQSHLQDKLVTSISLQRNDSLSLQITDDGALKRLKFHDLLTGQNDELGWEDLPARLDADLLLMAQALNQTLLSISQQLAAE